MVIRWLRLLALCLVMAHDATAQVPTNILGVINSNLDKFSKFKELYTESELTSPNFGCPFFCVALTLFCPFDSALDTEIMEKLKNPEFRMHVGDFVRSHTLFLESIDIDDIVDGDTYDAMDGTTLVATVSGTDVFVNDAEILFTDDSAYNGVLHGIDSYFLPSSLTTNVIEIAENNGFQILVEAIKKVNLESMLSDSNAIYTVFAPTDDAFASAGITLSDVQAGDVANLEDMIKSHVLSGQILERSEMTSSTYETLGSVDLDIAILGVFGALVSLNDRANLIAVNLRASNGIVHVVNAPLVVPQAADVPPSATTTIAQLIRLDSRLDELASLVSKSVEVDTLLSDAEGGPYTIFAPTDNAFRRYWRSGSDADRAELEYDTDGLLTNALKYHVVTEKLEVDDIRDGDELQTVQGGLIEVSRFVGIKLDNRAYVFDGDIQASNGVIHLINNVLRAPNDIVQTARNVGLDRFLEFLEAVDMDDFLRTPGPYTVFAPDDDAFDAALDDLGMTATELKDDQVLLTRILNYHIVPGEKRLEDIPEGDVATLADDGTATLEIEHQYWFFVFFAGIEINGSATLTAYDLTCTNGVIHPINRVLIPP